MRCRRAERDQQRVDGALAVDLPLAGRKLTLIEMYGFVPSSLAACY